MINVNNIINRWKRFIGLISKAHLPLFGNSTPFLVECVINNWTSAQVHIDESYYTNTLIKNGVFSRKQYWSMHFSRYSWGRVQQCGALRKAAPTSHSSYLKFMTSTSSEYIFLINKGAQVDRPSCHIGKVHHNNKTQTKASAQVCILYSLSNTLLTWAMKDFCPKPKYYINHVFNSKLKFHP